jgi:hypothetical protein
MKTGVECERAEGRPEAELTLVCCLCELGLLCSFWTFVALITPRIDIALSETKRFRKAAQLERLDGLRRMTQRYRRFSAQAGHGAGSCQKAPAGANSQ